MWSTVKIVAFGASLRFAQDPSCVVLGVRRSAVHPHTTLTTRTQQVVHMPLLLDPPALIDQLFDRLSDVWVFVDLVRHRSPKAVAEESRRSWEYAHS